MGINFKKLLKTFSIKSLLKKMLSKSKPINPNKIESSKEYYHELSAKSGTVFQRIIGGYFMKDLKENDGNPERVLEFEDCPRCGWNSVELLESCSYCLNCNYNSVEGLFPRANPMPPSTAKILREKKEEIAKRKDGALYQEINIAQIKNIQNMEQEGKNQKHLT